MRSAEQTMFHNVNWFEIDNRFQGKIYIISNIIRKFVCQATNCLIFQMAICYIGALLGGMNRRKGEMGRICLYKVDDLVKSHEFNYRWDFLRRHQSWLYFLTSRGGRRRYRSVNIRSFKPISYFMFLNTETVAPPDARSFTRAFTTVGNPCTFLISRDSTSRYLRPSLS